MAIRNPFSTTLPQSHEDFCNRVTEQSELEKHIESGSKVVVLSPRRYGKTSLMRRLQQNVETKGINTFYVDFLQAYDLRDVVRKLYTEMGPAILSAQESFTKKAWRLLRSLPFPLPVFDDQGLGVLWSRVGGFDDSQTKLEYLLKLLQLYIKESPSRTAVFFDEFQQITTLPQGSQLEATFREYIQDMPASFFFIGSRRTLLSEMFLDKHRPFYQSAIIYRLPAISVEDFTGFVKDKLESAGITCGYSEADYLVRLAGAFAYYVQLLGMETYLLAKEEKVVSFETVDKALKKTIQFLELQFEAIMDKISSRQQVLLRALAKAPTNEPMSQGYLHQLGMAASSVQRALPALQKKDLIQRGADGVYRVVDPIFAHWLISLG